MQVSDSTIKEKMQVEVGSLTVGELKLLIEETVAEAFKSLLIENDLLDPDAGKEMRPEFAAGLHQAIQETKTGKMHSPETVADELGLNWNEL